MHPQSKPSSPKEVVSNPHFVRQFIQTSWAWELDHRGVLPRKATSITLL